MLPQYGLSKHPMLLRDYGDIRALPSVRVMIDEVLYSEECYSDYSM